MALLTYTFCRCPLYCIIVLNYKINQNYLARYFCLISGLINVCLIFRSEQDKEPEQEPASENVNPGTSEESVAEGIPFTSRDCECTVLLLFNLVLDWPHTFSLISCSSSGNR